MDSCGQSRSPLGTAIAAVRAASGVGVFADSIVALLTRDNQIVRRVRSYRVSTSRDIRREDRRVDDYRVVGGYAGRDRARDESLDPALLTFIDLNKSTIECDLIYITETG